MFYSVGLKIRFSFERLKKKGCIIGCNIYYGICYDLNVVWYLFDKLWFNICYDFNEDIIYMVELCLMILEI